MRQPPSGGCVLKPNRSNAVQYEFNQPPSGGCVLKHAISILYDEVKYPAAFGRLRVETAHPCPLNYLLSQPPSGGCVLKPVLHGAVDIPTAQPPSGGCVLKPLLPLDGIRTSDPAAFGRLRVETPPKRVLY